MLEEQIKEAWIVHLGGVDHRVVEAEFATLHLLHLARIRVGAVFQKCAQSLQVPCAQGPCDQGNTVALGEDTVGVDPFIFDQSANGLHVAGFGRDSQLQCLPIEVVIGAMRRSCRAAAEHKKHQPCGYRQRGLHYMSRFNLWQAFQRRCSEDSG